MYAQCHIAKKAIIWRVSQSFVLQIISVRRGSRPFRRRIRWIWALSHPYRIKRKASDQLGARIQAIFRPIRNSEVIPPLLSWESLATDQIPPMGICFGRSTYIGAFRALYECMRERMYIATLSIGLRAAAIPCFP